MERIRQAIEIAKATRQQPAPRPGAARPAPAILSEGVAPQASLPASHHPVSRDHLAAMRIVAFDGKDPRTTHFDMLRTKVLPQMAEQGWTSLAITSPGPGCGKTVTAINLALSIARLPDRRVLLVDLDLRNPQIANYLGVAAEHDLAAVLAGKAPVGEAIVAPDLASRRFEVLPTLEPLPSSAETIVSARMKELVGQLKAAQPGELVIFDLPPMLASDDLLAFLPQVDCVLLVAAVGQSSAAEVKECERLLSGANFLGVVLNKAQEPTGSYYHKPVTGAGKSTG